MNRLKITGVTVILVAVFFLGLSPMALLAEEEETLCMKWVLVETSVNPNNELTEFRGGGSTPGYYTDARYDGKFDLYDVSETSFDVHTRAWDRRLFWDVNIGCTFDAPPRELIPGESYELTVDFAHSVVENNEVPRYAQQFNYNTEKPGVRLVLPEGMYAGNQFLYSPWDENFTGENSKTWTLDVIDKGAPFYGSPGDTWVLTAGWRGVACCYVTWTYEAQEYPCDSEAPCYPVILENIFSAGVSAGWAQIHAYWYALEAEPPLVVGTSEANDIITDLTGIRDHIEASGFPFEGYDAPINNLVAELRTGVRSLDIPEGIASLIHDPGGLQAQLRGSSCTQPSGEVVVLEHIFNAGVQAGWSHIRAYWYALEAKPPLVNTGEANEIITGLTAMGEHLEASGFPFEGYDAPIGNMIAELRTGVRSLDIPEGIASLMHDPRGLQAQLRGSSCEVCEEGVILPTPHPSPTTLGESAGLIVESRTVVPGGTVSVPVRLENVKNVGSLNFNVTYDTSVVNIDRIDKGSLLSGISFVANPNETGIIRFGFATENGVEGTGSIGYVVCNAVGSAGSNTPLTISGVEATDSSGNPVTLQTINGSVTINNNRIIGDHNGDGLITELDALAALRMSVNLLAEDLILDMDQNGSVTAKDALMILSIAVRGR